MPPVYTKGSWYSQLPPFGWFDREDKPGSAALQVNGKSIPDSEQGIALPSRAGLGKWYNVTPPGGDLPYPMQQTDVGPAKWTGRGVDISAAAAHKMGYTPKDFPTDATWKIEPRDEPRGLGSPAGMPVQAGDLPDNAAGGDAYAAAPKGRKMPDDNSLMSMFSPRDIGGAPTDLGNMLSQRSNSLIGLGLGLMSGTAQDPYSNAMRGYAQGASSDQDRYQAAQRLAEQRSARAQSMAEHRIDRAQAQKNWEQQFARGGESDFAKIARDLGLQPGSPEFIDQARKYALGKMEGEWDTKDIIDPNNPDEKITIQQHKRTGEIRHPTIPPSTAAAPQRSPFDIGAGGGVGYTTSGGAPSTTPPGAAAPAAGQTGAPVQRQQQSITLPNGEAVTAPPGLNKEARKAWANHVATTAAKMQAGEMTEGQAKYSIYATGMEIAQQELKGLEEQGTSQWGKQTSRVPLGLGTYLQSDEYQNYRNSKDAWLNAKLRAESGATINPDEFARDERIYFPQPGETKEQIAAKARLRENITEKMTKAGGPGYKSAPPIAGPTSTAAPASSGASPSGRAVRWGRDAKGNPVPLP